eukprot:410635-Amphidinium_carterae.1
MVDVDNRRAYQYEVDQKCKYVVRWFWFCSCAESETGLRCLSMAGWRASNFKCLVLLTLIIWSFS